LTESILIAKVGKQWVAATHGIMLCLRPSLSEAIKQAIMSANYTARRGVPIKVIVDNDMARYTVWNSELDGFAD